MADLVEPFPERLGDFVGLGVGLVGDGDGEVVDGDVFLCFRGDGDLQTVSCCRTFGEMILVAWEVILRARSLTVSPDGATPW